MPKTFLQERVIADILAEGAMTVEELMEKFELSHTHVNNILKRMGHFVTKAPGFYVAQPEAFRFISDEQLLSREIKYTVDALGWMMQAFTITGEKKYKKMAETLSRRLIQCALLTLIRSQTAIENNEKQNVDPTQSKQWDEFYSTVFKRLRSIKSSV